jgi:hypothetical protein
MALRRSDRSPYQTGSGFNLSTIPTTVSIDGLAFGFPIVSSHGLRIQNIGDPAYGGTGGNKYQLVAYPDRAAYQARLSSNVSSSSCVKSSNVTALTNAYVKDGVNGTFSWVTDATRGSATNVSGLVIPISGMYNFSAAFASSTTGVTKLFVLYRVTSTGVFHPLGHGFGNLPLSTSSASVYFDKDDVFSIYTDGNSGSLRGDLPNSYAGYVADYVSRFSLCYVAPY